MALIACPNCGHEVDDSARRCPNCGQALRDEAVQGEAERTVAGSETETAEVGAPASGPAADTADPREAGTTVEDEELPAEERTADADPAPEPRGWAAIQWSPVLAGFATILLAGILLPVILPLSVTPIVAIAAGMFVTASMARRAKFLNATTVLAIYLIVNFVLALLIGAPPTPEGGAGNGAP